MERREYLARLDRALRELTGSREREDILAYYREYLEEAGSEGEAEAMDALGAPEALALHSVEPVPEAPPSPKRRRFPRPAPAEDICRCPAALLGLRFEAVRLDVDGVQVRLEAGSLVTITVPRGERLNVDAGTGAVELQGTRAGALDLRSKTGISAPGSRVPQRLRGRVPPKRRQINRREHLPIHLRVDTGRLLQRG